MAYNLRAGVECVFELREVAMRFEFKESLMMFAESARRVALVLMFLGGVFYWFFLRRMAAAMNSEDAGPPSLQEMVFLGLGGVVWFLLFAVRFNRRAA
jgi:hypothetical protein